MPRHRGRHRTRRSPAAATPAAARFSSACDRSWPGPAAGRDADRHAGLATARSHLEHLWSPAAHSWPVLCDLIHEFGCSRPEAQIRVAVRDAVQRARDAGLDPTPVRARAGRLLRGRSRC